jgi:hypothetical protein
MDKLALFLIILMATAAIVHADGGGDITFKPADRDPFISAMTTI